MKFSTATGTIAAFVAIGNASSPGCGHQNAATELVMQFTPMQPVQKAPVSTIYKTIVTKHMNVVDCNYVSVQNVDANAAPTGVFTTKVVVPTMTVYRVNCMAQTADVTRRGLGMYGQNAATPESTGAVIGNINGVHYSDSGLVSEQSNQGAVDDMNVLRSSIPKQDHDASADDMNVLRSNIPEQNQGASVDDMNVLRSGVPDLYIDQTMDVVIAGVSPLRSHSESTQSKDADVDEMNVLRSRIPDQGIDAANGETNVLRSAVPESDFTQDTDNTQVLKRTVFDGQTLDGLESMIQHVQITQYNSYDNMTVQEASFIRSINTAMFSLTVIFSGLNLESTCNAVNNAVVAQQMTRANLDSRQAANVICFAWIFGVDFDESIEELLADLNALVYAIVTKINAVTEKICNDFSGSQLPELGVPINDIFEVLCGREYSSAEPTMSSTMHSNTSMPEATAAPNKSTSLWNSTATTAVGEPQGTTFGVMPSEGTGLPQSNGTHTPAAAETSQGTDSAAHTPSGPTSQWYYPTRRRQAWQW